MVQDPENFWNKPATGEYEAVKHRGITIATSFEEPYLKTPTESPIIDTKGA